MARPSPEDHDSSIVYYPYSHDFNKSMLNSSATTLLDGSGGTGRPVGSSFTSQSGITPGFHHTGNLQGLHNQGNYNMQTIQNTISSRNAGFGGPAGGAHQGGGNVAPGRFSSNNLGVGLSQLSQGGLHGHSSMPNRTGISVVGNHSFSNNVNGVGVSGVVSPRSGSISNRGSLPGMGGSPSQMGSVGPRIASSVGGIGGGGGVSLAGGGGLTRALNAGGGVNMQTLNSSRVNMGQVSSSSGIGVQGPGRPANSLLQQGVNMSSPTHNPSGDLLAMFSRASPQGVSSMLGNSISTSPGTQGQVHSANGHGRGMGVGSDGNSNDGVAFDINDFPQLTTRHSPSVIMQGAVVGLRKQGVGINAIVQQNQEFSIQNEDFPALPGYKGGSHELTSEMRQQRNDQQHDLAAMQSQHFSIGRSPGFSQGGSYESSRHLLQQQQQGGNASDQLCGVRDSFSPARGLPASYHSQAVGPPGAGAGATHVQRFGFGGALGQYDQRLNYQHQSPFRQGGAFTQQHQMGMAASFRESSKQGGSAQQPDQNGLLGLLNVIRMSDPDLTTLALGTDLTTLGLNLNSRENLYKTFASPWADEPVRGEADFMVPSCYEQQAPLLQPSHFIKFQENTLFYIFYSMPRDGAQLHAADELSNRGWLFHKELKRWLKRAPNSEPMVKTPAYERGTFFFLDPTSLDLGCKENFVLHYDMLEKRPQLPAQH